MWRYALAAHEAGRVRATEVRASDFIQGNGAFGLMVAKPVLAGKRAVVAVPTDQPHSFTSVNDVAATLITVAGDEWAWGKAWHAPVNPPLTLRQLATRFAEIAGAPPPKLTAIPYAALWAAGVFVPIVRELRATRYQWDRPFVMSSAAAQDAFGLKPQPLDEALRETARLIQS
jgi:nucleoside-diphosphate-sugar epimerase